MHLASEQEDCSERHLLFKTENYCLKINYSTVALEKLGNSEANLEI